MTDGLYTSALLSTISEIQHGVTTRKLADARQKNSYAGVSQVHGSTIAVVDGNVGHPLPEADGLVTKTSGLTIGVRTADCVPILLVDPKARVVAAVHAGWKGTFLYIARNAVAAMTAAGADPSDIFAFIGPHIGACCYIVDNDRAKRFEDVYLDNEGWHLDLGAENRRQLLDAGLTPDHIDSPITCTSCQIDRFYSYRKDSKETFGEMLSFITLV